MSGDNTNDNTKGDIASSNNNIKDSSPKEAVDHEAIRLEREGFTKDILNVIEHEAMTMDHDLKVLASLNHKRATPLELYISYMRNIFAMGKSLGDTEGRRKGHAASMTFVSDELKRFAHDNSSPRLMKIAELIRTNWYQRGYEDGRKSYQLDRYQKGYQDGMIAGRNEAMRLVSEGSIGCQAPKEDQ